MKVDTVPRKGTKAKAKKGERICRTYAELAQALGMTGSNPTRIISRWATEPDWPGRPATPGKRDGHLPLEKIRQWRAERERSNGRHDSDEELSAARRRLALLKLEREERDALLAAGRLADVDEIAAFNAQCVANAKAILDPIPDVVVRQLPKRTNAQTRRQVHADVTAVLDDAYMEIARILAGDDDVEEEGES